VQTRAQLEADLTENNSPGHCGKSGSVREAAAVCSRRIPWKSSPDLSKTEDGRRQPELEQKAKR